MTSKIAKSIVRGRLSPSTCGLFVVDIQEKFIPHVAHHKAVIAVGERMVKVYLVFFVYIFLILNI